MVDRSANVRSLIGLTKDHSPSKLETLHFQHIAPVRLNLLS